MKKILIASCLLALPAFVACKSESTEQPLGNDPQATPPPNGQADQANGTGGEDNTHDHMADPAAEPNPNGTNVEEKKRDEAAIGSANIVSRLHACGKVNYETLGNILRDRGVDLEGNGAGRLLRDGRLALGVPNYRARISEAAFPSTSALTKMFDIFMVAAAEIRENLPDSTACPGVEVLDAQGHLTRDAITCLTGVPTTDLHLELARLYVDKPEYEERKTEAIDLTIATLLSSHQLCE